MAPHLHAGAAHRRDRHRQGGDGAPASTAGRRAPEPLRADQLRRDPQRADGGASCSATRGARSRAPSPAYDGQLMAAAGGTVFLDEIDDTPLADAGQAAARARGPRGHAGSARTPGSEVDFRIVAATNRDLRRAHRGRAVRPGPLRAARDRAHRAAAAARAAARTCRRWRRTSCARFCRASTASRSASPTIAPAALARCSRYAWPGNIRELRNVIYQALVYKRAGDGLLLSDLPRGCSTRGAERRATRRRRSRRRLARVERRRDRTCKRRGDGARADRARRR